MTPKETLVFGIEGPAGSGKSTMANTVGREMGIPVVEGGPFYRRLAYAALQSGIDLSDTAQLVELAAAAPSQFTISKANSTTYNGQDITSALRSEAVSTTVSAISRQSEVRDVVKEQIREAVLSHEVTIFVGRSIKLTFPDAYVLHVDINPDEAERRHAGRQEGSAQAVKQRNAADSETAKTLGVSSAHEATIDVTNLTPDEQAAVLRQFIETRQLD